MIAFLGVAERKPVCLFAAQAPTLGMSTCQLSLGMHIQILYANIGALVNPQPKIIGVSFVYDSPKAVQIRVSLFMCVPAANEIDQN